MTLKKLATNLLLYYMLLLNSTLDCFGKNTDGIGKSITYELQKVFKWFDINKLCLNVSKSKFMLFHVPQKYFSIIIQYQWIYYGVCNRV